MACIFKSTYTRETLILRYLHDYLRLLPLTTYRRYPRMWACSGGSTIDIYLGCVYDGPCNNLDVLLTALAFLGRKSRYRRATSPLISLRFYDLDVPPASLEDVSSESRFEDVTSGTSLESMPQSSNHISDLRTFLFLDFADEEDLTERSLHPRDTAGYSFSSYVQRLMLSDHLTDIVNESPLSLRKLCKNFGVHEIAAPVHLVANLFSPVPQQKDTWTPYGDSSGPADEGQQSSTTLHLTLLDGGVEFLQETFRNASTSAERVNKLALISPESSRFLDSTSLFIFPNLTHLALSVASFDTIQLFQDLPNLQRLIFLTDRKGFERSTKGETKDVLMQHIFGNRKVLALPDVGKYTACRRNDPFVISWQENTMGLWEAAERYTTNESIKLLRYVEGTCKSYPTVAE